MAMAGIRSVYVISSPSRKIRKQDRVDKDDNTTCRLRHRLPLSSFLIESINVIKLNQSLPEESFLSAQGGPIVEKTSQGATCAK